MSAPLADFAAEIGPQLDRLRLGVMRAAVEAAMKSGMLAGSGLDPDMLAVFAMLRNAYPDRSVPVRNFRAPYIYQDSAKFEAALSRMVETGLVDIARTESVTLSEPGRILTAQIRAVTAQAADDLWGSDLLPVLPLADRCLLAAAATATADGAFHLVAPPHDEPDDSDATRLAERLTGLRWHRFDAHVAAWTSAGLSAHSVTDLAKQASESKRGKQHQSIEPRRWTSAAVCRSDRNA
jgi:hypothetical protein